MKKRALVMLLALALVLSATGCANTPAEENSSSSTVTQEEYDALKEQNEQLQAELDELKGETDEETESDAESGSSSEAETSSTADGSSSAGSSSSSQSSTSSGTPATTSGSSQSAAQQSSSNNSAASQSSAQSQSSAARTPAPQKADASSGKWPLAMYTVRVSDSSTPATNVQGELYNGELAYVFYSSSGKVLGTVPDSVISQILWDNNLTQAEDDEQKSWFVENFNVYRGLDGGSYEGSTGSGSSSSSDIDIEEYKDEVFRLINAARKSEGLEPFVSHSTAMEFAQIRAEEISEKFSHTRPDGSVMTYSHYNFAENIAKGGKTPEDAVNSWLNSSGHRAAIMADYSYCGNGMGVGVFEKNGTMYWVVEFVGWDSEG